MITIGYPPHQVGGTETYVLGLVESLKRRGYRCYVTYIEPFEDSERPGIEVVSRTYLETPVHVVRVNRVHHQLEFIMFDEVTRERVLDTFRTIVESVQPNIVHVHPLNLGFESYLIESLKQIGQKVVLTYHSSTTGCIRGDLIYLDKEVCDGQIMQKRCTICLYHKKGVWLSTAYLLSKLPLALFRLGYSLSNVTRKTHKLRSFFSIPLLIEAISTAWSRAMYNADAVVAVCRWARNVIVSNKVPPHKVVTSRHGLRIKNSRLLRQGIAETVCFGYLGRIGTEKGIGVLLDALESMPMNFSYRFEFCSSTFNSNKNSLKDQELVNRIRRLTTNDYRVIVHGHVEDNQLTDMLAGWDAIVVPSLWLESGPLVVYEAFSVQTPVIGSERGGIAELVEPGKTGFLVPAGDANALRKMLQLCSRDPNLLRSLRKNIGRVRTTDEVGDDMTNLYFRIGTTAEKKASTNHLNAMI